MYIGKKLTIKRFRKLSSTLNNLNGKEKYKMSFKKFYPLKI